MKKTKRIASILNWNKKFSQLKIMAVVQLRNIFYEIVEKISLEDPSSNVHSIFIKSTTRFNYMIAPLAVITSSVFFLFR